MKSGSDAADESPEPAFRFDAFLSYSRTDADFTKSLEKKLRSYLPPRDLGVPHRRLRIFRDLSDISGVELTNALNSHLRDAAKLIVICSPAARSSPYVNQEIEAFGAIRGPEHIIPILVRGLPNNEAGLEQEKECAFPSALIALLPTPLAAEFREFRPNKDRIGRGAYEPGWLKTLADLYADYGVTRAQVEQREKRRKARQRNILTAITAAIVLALLALTAWALNERNEAIRQRNTAVSRQLASESGGLVKERPDLALLLAASAYRFSPTLEARQSLLTCFLERPRLRRFLWGHAGSTECLAFSPDGRILASGGADDGKVIVWDTMSGARLFEAVADVKVVKSVVFTPDGQRLISAGKDGQIKIWDASSGALQRALVAAGKFLETIALSPDGARLVSGLWSGKLELWEMASGRRLGEITPHTGIPGSITFSPDGRLIASGSADGSVALWDGTPGHAPRMLSGHAPGVKHLAFSPGGETLAVAFGVGQVNLWQVDSGQLLRTLVAPEADHDASEGARVAFSPDGKLLAHSGTLGHTATVWDLATQNRVARLPGGSFGIHSIAFSHRGDRIALAGGDGVVRLWETARWSSLAEQSGGHGQVLFSSDDRTLATGGRDRVALWEVEEPPILRSLPPHQERVGRIQFSPDGNHLASASFDGDVAVWNVPAGRIVGKYQPPKEPNADLEPGLHGKELRVLAFSPDGQTLATGGRQGQRFGEGGRRGDLVLWEFAGSGKTKMLAGHNSGLRAVAYSPDGRQLASADSSTVRLWNLASGEARVMRETKGALTLVFDPASKKLAAGAGDEVLVWDLAASAGPAVIGGHERPVRLLRFSPDGRVLISGSFDGTLRFWDATAQTPALAGVGRHTRDITDLAISSDGRFAVSASQDQTIGIWDSRTGKLIRRLTGHNAEVDSVALSGDGTILASAGNDGKLILWDMATGSELVRLGRMGTRVAFSPTAALLATGGASDLRVSLWDVDVQTWADRACSAANRNFSAKEWLQYFGDLPYQKMSPHAPSPKPETADASGQ